MERISNKWNGYGFSTNKQIQTEISENIKNAYQDIITNKKNKEVKDFTEKSISKEELKIKLENSLNEVNKKRIKDENFGKHCDGEIKKYLDLYDKILQKEAEEKEKEERKKELLRYQELNRELNSRLDQQLSIINQLARENNKKQEIVQKMKNAFEARQKIIENKNVEESKKEIEKYIANEFLKEFEIEKEKKSQLKQSLTSRIQNFTQEFMNFCVKFIIFFKSNTDKIIKEFDIKENNPIEHINFIVIGRAGVGKSTFINESLLLPENKRAKEGIGESVTKESVLYTSDKLKMVRMWDTEGLSIDKNLDSILNEVKRLVNIGKDKGPDHYINIILYCREGNRFENIEGQLIYEIMKIYPFDNLPVVITQLQSLSKEKAHKMEKVIRDILDKYLDHKIVQKIEIKNILSRDDKDEYTNNIIPAYGIPELLKLSFDIMGRSISSATCLAISSNITELCKSFMDKKKKFIQNLFKYEMEILEVAKSLFNNEEEEDDHDYFDDKKQKELSEFNIYKKIENPNYFVDNFGKNMKNKFLDIFNNLENENIPLDEIKIEKENEEENKEEEKKEEQNEEQKENEKENKGEEKKEDENEEQKENEEENKEEEKKEKDNEEQKENEEENKEEKDKTAFVTFLEERLKKIIKNLEEASNKKFKKIFNKRNVIYLNELEKEQEDKQEEFNDKTQILNKSKAKDNFQKQLFAYYKNEFFKIFFCIILKLFMNSLNDNFDMYVKKEITDNEDVLKIIHQKAENSLKTVTENLKKSLISELDDVMKAKEEKDNKVEKENEFDNDDVDFDF